MPVLEINRFEIAQRLSGTSLIGIELGVAKGFFAKRMVESGIFSKFYGVDAYSDGHDTKEYLGALNTVGLDENYTLIRSYFDEALHLFPDSYFDFIYVDGYAHTGEMGGETLFNWLEKLKPGGIIAGDDYDEKKWPLVYEAVNGFVAAVEGKLMTTSPHKTDPKSVYDRYVSWFVTDDGLRRGQSADPYLVAKGKEAFNRKRTAYNG